ncbi:MAG: radical SAM family heme chaperone HemW [Proteobacteria bacterium]|nr:radical SAM family heme chaperone HemW [Pseudomonadota bacterium]
MHRPNFFDTPLEGLFPEDSFGIYVHVPFCVRRCRYCAFVSSVWRQVPSAEYAAALCREFDARYGAYGERRLLTLYFGGGTPTMLSDDALEGIVSHIVSCTGMPEEMTLEANPEHVTRERAARWKALGVTRISLGVQAFDSKMLAFLGRKHDGDEARNAVKTLLEAGFEEISIDLIYGGLPEPADAACALARWRQELALARGCGAVHVSCYELTLEQNTPLWTLQKRGGQILCDEACLAEMMAVIPGVLSMAQYEVSNYARPGYFSAHNMSCWAGVPYLGLGPAAHSLAIEDGRISRRANSADVRRWLAAMSAGELPDPEFVEALTPQTHLSERLMCAARTRLAWNPARIAEKLGTSAAPFLPALEKACAQGLLARAREGFCTTDDGMRLNNRIDALIFDGI